MMEKPVVSVYCLTYNHEKYIRQCLDGFVMQKTDFPFEVIVHDDASTDKTADIIREYAGKYPKIIKPIFQTENQYSKKVPIIKTFIWPRIQGKYIAACEGDDYWIDPLKLQKQKDALDVHPECGLCVCTVRAVDESGSRMDKTYPSELLETGSMDSETFLKYACKEYAFQTSSYFFRKEIEDELLFNPPKFYKVAPVGDWPLLLYSASIGDVFYYRDEMSCYRRNSIGSFSSNMHQADNEKLKKYYTAMVAMMDAFDEYTNGRYHSSCESFNSRHYYYYYYCLIREKNYREVLSIKYRPFFMKENWKDRWIIWNTVNCPLLVTLYNKIKSFLYSINR